MDGVFDESASEKTQTSLVQCTYMSPTISVNFVNEYVLSHT